MATSSIYKTVKICNKEDGERLANALEASQKEQASKVNLKSSARRIDKSEIKEFFEKRAK